jgi:hypothetical protein
MRLLTIGTEYRGGMTLFGCGITSANIFDAEIMRICGDAISLNIKLRGVECTEQKIIASIHRILHDLKDENVIIYYSGHGNIHSNIEYWQASSGTVDQIKIANLLNEITDNSIVYLFSDSCSSSHMCNQKIIHKNYVSIGATQDHEDAIITSEGGVMTCVIVEILKTIKPGFTVRHLWNAMLDAGISIEHFSLKFSDEIYLDQPMFLF